nr:glycosyltransferase [Brevundimonas variabilis]
MSIVVVGFDMARELPRTVQSLLPPYQQGIDLADIEIIVVDNGSADPVQRTDFGHEGNITVLRVEDGGTSPCRAINRGAALARADRLAVMIDGARMASPGLLATAVQASRIDPDAFIATLGFHLGPKVQQISTSEGYTRAVEDQMLADIGWPADGYRLFEICALGESYAHGVLQTPPETTFFLMGRDRFLKMGGYNEAFTGLGGGLSSFDFFNRAVADPEVPFIMLVGEGTFHQLHYGATTREGGVRRPAPEGEGTLGDVYAREYQAITGQPLAMATALPLLFGRLKHPAARHYFFPTVHD